MFGFFKRKATAVAIEAKKVENRDEFEAIIWGGVDITYADGSSDQDEIDTLKAIVLSTPALEVFAGQVDTEVAKVIEQYNLSPNRARLQTMRELSDLTVDEQAKENVYAILVDIADQGGREQAETNRLLEMARTLNVNAAKFGVTA